MTDEEVSEALRQYRIGLTVDEARKVHAMLGRAPTITEAVIWGIQGSEHCSYKSSRRFLRGFPTEGRHVILGPKEDSGIVAISDGPDGKRWGIVISHESHNHPSQIVPYEGAATGVGGCVRDVACMGARVIGTLDSLRLGRLEHETSRTVAEGVIRGIAGYANALGIPNLGGDTVFDAAYDGSCLVNVVAVGLLREDEIIHSYVPEEAGRVGYDIIVVGKATDRSGFGGASFASATMEADAGEKNAGAVQEPNPFLERHLLASTYALFDWLVATGNLSRVSFKDLGAGGNVCASVEQVAPRGMGARIDLDRIHVALPDLPAQVIACAETQERFCWICHPELTSTIVRHYNETWDLPGIAEGARASVIGSVIPEDRYILTHKGIVVCDAPSTAITSGLQYVRPTRQPVQAFHEPDITCRVDTVSILGMKFALRQVFLALTSDPTSASKDRVIRHYDKNILGATLLEPGEGDACVIQPLETIECLESEIGHPDWGRTLRKEDRSIGVALACGGNGRYGRISPYRQGYLAVAENVRNIVAVGASPRAVSDCLNYGNPEIPEQLWALEEGVRGIADACRALGDNGEAIPVISGNVSLYNCTPEGPIDPTANVCVIGVLPDASKVPGMRFRTPGAAILCIGERMDECGGSAYYHILEQMLHVDRNTVLGANVPMPNPEKFVQECRAVRSIIDGGLASAVHDISDGGLALALFEMTLPSRGLGGVLGARVNLDRFASKLRTDILLFSETGGFLLEVPPEHLNAALQCCNAAKVTAYEIGEVTKESSIVFRRRSRDIINVTLSDARLRWSRTLDDYMGLA